jgi:cytochrome c-type biogenesis protein CcmH
LLLVFSFSIAAGVAADLDEQARQIAAELRCPVCQNLSVADSPSELAQQMRALVAEQLKEGKTPEQVKAFFVSKYGEWVLLAPEPKGFSLLLWVFPYAAALTGIVLVILTARRWVRRGKNARKATADPDLVARIRQEEREPAFK